MRTGALLGLAALCVIVTPVRAWAAGQVPAAAPVRPTMANAHRGQVSAARPQIGVQPGRQLPTVVQPFRPLQLQIAPRRIEPSPMASPEFNPLKRRRMALPGLPDTELAF